MTHPAGPSDDERLTSALASSFLASLAVETQLLLTAGGILLDVPAGSVVYRNEEAPRGIGWRSVSQTRLSPTCP
jgi:hypothetical protein